MSRDDERDICEIATASRRSFQKAAKRRRASSVGPLRCLFAHCEEGDVQVVRWSEESIFPLCATHRQEFGE